jgi:hypothetical protein
VGYKYRDPRAVWKCFRSPSKTASCVPASGASNPRRRPLRCFKQSSWALEIHASASFGPKRQANGLSFEDTGKCQAVFLTAMRMRLAFQAVFASSVVLLQTDRCCGRARPNDGQPVTRGPSQHPAKSCNAAQRQTRWSTAPKGAESSRRSRRSRLAVVKSGQVEGSRCAAVGLNYVLKIPRPAPHQHGNALALIPDGTN